MAQSTTQSIATTDVTYDGLNQYLYDAEGRICAVASPNGLGGTFTMGYLYDAEGERIAKGTITAWSCDPTTNGFQITQNYVLGPSGEELSMLDGSGNWQLTNVYAGGKLIGTYDLIHNPKAGQSGQPQQIPALHFHIEDPLGTRRIQLSGSPGFVGAPETDIQSLPYGDGLFPYADAYAVSTADDATPLHFTGKERDAESGNDYFGARYYASSMGRWLSPDWSAKVEPVPYAKLDNPQSLNLYSYVWNNPLSRNDPDGHEVDLTGTDKDKQLEQQRLVANASKKGEAGLFKPVTDKNGKTTLQLDSKAAANFKGDHSAGYNLLTGAIGAKQTISVQLTSDDRPYTGIPDAKGNMSVFLPRNESALDRIAPLKGLKGQDIPNPFQIIAGHEVLGHAYAGDILGMTKGMSYQQEEIWVRQNIENTLRQEQNIPLRDPNSN